MKKSWTSIQPPRRRRRFEEDGTFFVGEVTNPSQRPFRVLCFRNTETGAVGASRRFSRAEAYRKSKRGRPQCGASAKRNAA